MYIAYGTDVQGNEFTESSKQKVWQKASALVGVDPTIFRKDAQGSWMIYDEYDNTLSGYGWEIDHIYPKSKGGTDDINNLQPLYWENNRAKADKTGWEWGNEEIHLDENSKSIYKVRKDGIF